MKQETLSIEIIPGLVLICDTIDRAKFISRSERPSMHEIAQILSTLQADEIEIFLEQLLTETEQDMIRRRWELVRLLHEGVPQRDIASRLSMSLCKVTRGAKELKRPDSVFRKILEEKQSTTGACETQIPGGEHS